MEIIFNLTMTIIICWLGESTLWWYILNKKMYFFLGYILCYFGVGFLSFHLAFWKTHQIDFYTKPPT
jgi:hypothetical protein